MSQIRRFSAVMQVCRALLVASGLLLSAGCIGQPTPMPATEISPAPSATHTASAATAAAPATTTQPAPATPVEPTSMPPTSTAVAALPPTPVACPLEVATIQPLTAPAFPLDIVFVGEDNAWLWSEADAGAAPLAILDRIRNVRISGDGRWIALVRQIGAGEELWVIERDGAGEQLLMDTEAMLQLVSGPLVDAVLVEQLDWVPGTHTLAFNSSTVISGVSQRLNNDLRLINVDSGERPLWLPAGEGGAFSFSPDGRQVILRQPEQLSLARADGQDSPTPVISYASAIELEQPPQPVWATDSGSLMVALPGEIGVFFVWRLDVGEAPAMVDEKIGLPGSVAISPNLAVVAYLRPGPGEFEQRELHLAAPDGSWDIVYDAGLALEFTGWSPDGVTFTYQMLPAEGGPATAYVGQLCAPRTAFAPAPAHGMTWQTLRWADPDRFVYVSDDAGAWELRLGSIEGQSELLAEINQPQPIFDLSGDR